MVELIMIMIIAFLMKMFNSMEEQIINRIAGCILRCMKAELNCPNYSAFEHKSNFGLDKHLLADSVVNIRHTKMHKLIESPMKKNI